MFHPIKCVQATTPTTKISSNQIQQLLHILTQDKQHNLKQYMGIWDTFVSDTVALTVIYIIWIGCIWCLKPSNNHDQEQELDV